MNYILQKVNCKALIVALLVFVGVMVSVQAVFAYDRVYIYTSGTFNLENTFIPSLTNIKHSYVLDVSPRSSLSQSVTIDYDDLADLVYYCNEHGLSTSLVYNNSVSRYVAYVSDNEFKISALRTVSIYGCLGNSDGKVYVAEKPEHNTNITITTPTNPDYTDRLLNIASNLDFLPIIAELNVLIADNQLLVMEYIKLAIESIWDMENSMIDHIDDLNTAVNNRLAYIGARVASADNHVVGIAEQLGSVIKNGAVQVNTTSLEARLDKLISMYSKVNSVVLDTASVNGGSITGAVGGELQDVIFWGDTGKYNNEFLTPDSLWYRLGPNVANSTRYAIDDSIVLRSVNLGSSVPSYISNDPVLYAGVWQKGTDYIISDTYNASTGEYVQRVGCVDFGSLSWSYVSQGANSRWFCTSLPEGFLEHDNIYTAGPLNSTRLSNVSYASLFNHTSDVCYSHAYGWETLCFYSSYLDDASIDLSSRLSGFLLMYPRSPIATSYNPATIAIPEGSSYISSYNVRITGKYETYDSYAQTADIISGIGRTEALLASINSYSSAISTNVGKVNTALTSVIEDGKLKVDNSAVVAAIEGIQAGTAADLSPVVVRMDAILAELQSAPGSAACEHTYTQHTEQEATCTLPGLLIFTCSQCGDSYSEIVDPLGHDWIVTSHVDAVTDPETGEETASAYDVYTCSRCQRTYEDHDGSGPEEDYSSSSISKLVVKVFSRLGTFAGKLIGSVIHLFDKAITALDNMVSKFNEYVEQISGFGGGYPAWLTGFWGVLPAELQVALTFAVICMALGVVGKKLFFS